MGWGWLCRLFGHWDRRGSVVQDPTDHVADYRCCRLCGRYRETIRDGWSLKSMMDRQNQYEAEGAAAFLRGLTAEDCPYDKVKNHTGWVFWINGVLTAKHEQETLSRGVVYMSSCGPQYETMDSWVETTEQAWRRQHWRPKYLSVPEFWCEPVNWRLDAAPQIRS